MRYIRVSVRRQQCIIDYIAVSKVCSQIPKDKAQHALLNKQIISITRTKRTGRFNLGVRWHKVIVNFTIYLLLSAQWISSKCEIELKHTVA